MSLTCTNYLKIDELLELQQLKSDPAEYDEIRLGNSSDEKGQDVTPSEQS